MRIIEGKKFYKADMDKAVKIDGHEELGVVLTKNS